MRDWKEASLFASDTNWKILETLRSAGIDGLTVKEISSATNIPISTVYDVLGTFQAGNWVESSRRKSAWGRPKKEAEQRLSSTSYFSLDAKYRCSLIVILP